MSFRAVYANSSAWNREPKRTEHQEKSRPKEIKAQERSIKKTVSVYGTFVFKKP